MALLAAFAVTGWAQVFPVKWDEPEPPAEDIFLIPSAGLGGGVIQLDPSLTAIPAPGGGGANARGRLFGDDDCTAATRGTLRVRVLSDLELPSGTTVDIDALCLCGRKDFTDPEGSVATYYRWSCFNTDTLLVNFA